MINKHTEIHENIVKTLQNRSKIRSKIDQKFNKIGLRRHMRLGHNKKPRVPIYSAHFGPHFGPMLGTKTHQNSMQNFDVFSIDFLIDFWPILGPCWAPSWEVFRWFFAFFSDSSWDIILEWFWHRFLIDFGPPKTSKIEPPLKREHNFWLFMDLILNAFLEPMLDPKRPPKSTPRASKIASKTKRKIHAIWMRILDPTWAKIGPPRGPSWATISAIFWTFFACYVGWRFWSNFDRKMRRPSGTYRGPSRLE